MPLGLYISVPFCRTKCSFCNFASGVFSRELHERYVAHIERELAGAEALAQSMGGRWERRVDSVYLGGGTPSVLDGDHLERLFASVRGSFDVESDAEITVECAPGTLTPELIATLVRCGVNRVSLGVQSFVDQESRSVGRLHTREIVLTEIARLREAGIDEISVDLIAGLPYQTMESWKYSLDEVIATGVPHVSVYMLEVDEDSRLGRELIAGGTRYHAHHVPDDDLTAEMYERAVERLNAAGVDQYEISNFARADRAANRKSTTPPLATTAKDGAPGARAHASRHNLKYWLREPYLGFGVDAHSMLESASKEYDAVRFATSDDLDQLLAGAPRTKTVVGREQAIEEEWFLGLRLVRGVNTAKLAAKYGAEAVERYRDALAELHGDGLIVVDGEWVRLTDRGRMISNTVFEKFVADVEPRTRNAESPVLRILI